MAEGYDIASFNAITTAQLTATTASSGFVFTDAASIQAPDIMVDNEGTTNIVYIAFGASTATAAVPTSTPAFGCVPVLPGQCKVLTKGSGNAAVAMITAASTTKVDVSAGQGS